MPLGISYFRPTYSDNTISDLKLNACYQNEEMKIPLRGWVGIKPTIVVYTYYSALLHLYGPYLSI